MVELGLVGSLCGCLTRSSVIKGADAGPTSQQELRPASKGFGCFGESASKVTTTERMLIDCKNTTRARQKGFVR